MCPICNVIVLQPSIAIACSLNIWRSRATMYEYIRSVGSSNFMTVNHANDGMHVDCEENILSNSSIFSGLRWMNWSNGRKESERKKKLSMVWISLIKNMKMLCTSIDATSILAEHCKQLTTRILKFKFKFKFLLKEFRVFLLYARIDIMSNSRLPYNKAVNLFRKYWIFRQENWAENYSIWYIIWNISVDKTRK